MTGTHSSYALVTGASSGIGRELAILLAQDGYNLILVSRTESQLQTLAHELTTQYKVMVVAIPGDLALPETADHIFSICKEKGLTVEVVINNAGFGDMGGLCRKFFATSAGHAPGKYC